MTKPLKLIFLLIGCLLLGWAVSTVDLLAVADLLIKLGYGFIIILILYSSVTWVDTVAWKNNFKKEETRQFSLWSLWCIRQIGEAYNTITPLGTLGGETHQGPTFKRKTWALSETGDGLPGDSAYHISHRPHFILYSRHVFHNAIRDNLRKNKDGLSSCDGNPLYTNTFFSYFSSHWNFR